MNRTKINRRGHLDRVPLIRPDPPDARTRGYITYRRPFFPLIATGTALDNAHAA